jgi:hypothetical protein
LRVEALVLCGFRRDAMTEVTLTTDSFRPRRVARLCGFVAEVKAQATINRA